MSISIEDTWAAKTIAAYKDAAREVGQVLLYAKDSEDFPSDAVGQYELLKRLQSISNDIQTVVTSMSRQLVRTKDKNNKLVAKEYLTIGGEFQTVNYRGVPYGVEFLAGKHNRRNVVIRPDQRFNAETGEALRSEKMLSGQGPIYTIELSKDPKKRKQMIDDFIGENDLAQITFYYRDLIVGNVSGKRDGTLSYEQFVNSSIEELEQISEKGVGDKGPGWYRGKDGKLYDKDDNPVQ